jgi:hypothetical protein
LLLVAFFSLWLYVAGVVFVRLLLVCELAGWDFREQGMHQ